MKKPRNGLLPMSVICRFCKVVSGRINLHEQSLLDHAVDCLRQIGIERTGPMRARNFIELHREEILARSREAPPDLRVKALRYPIRREVASADVASDASLATYEWRVLRMKVLKRDGAKCACCGATPATGAVMNVDHIKPRRFYPGLALDENNLQVLCHECNHGKGNWDQTDWRNG